MDVTPEMVQVAVKKAVELELLSKYAGLEEYVKYYSFLQKILEAGLDRDKIIEKLSDGVDDQMAIGLIKSCVGIAEVSMLMGRSLEETLEKYENQA